MEADLKNQTVVRVQKVAILILVLLLAGFWGYVKWVEPRPFYTIQSYDPELPYMLSSLSVFKGHAYTFIDHPGTPVEMLGSAFLALTYPLTMSNPDSFVVYHLKNPDLFLGLAWAFLTLGSIICCTLLARYATAIENWADVLGSIAIAACFFAIHPVAFTYMTLWSHNSFNFPFGSLLLLGLLVLFRSKRKIQWWQVSLLGFGTGALTAVQLYFATWVIGITTAIVTLYLFEKRGWLQTALAGSNVGLASLFGFVIATLPIIPEYPRFIQWVVNLLLHQGRYGEGASGVTSSEQLVTNFLQLRDPLQVLFIATGLIIALVGIAMLLRRHNFRQNVREWAVACGLLVQLTVTVLIILKHPNPKYMLAVAAILPLLLAIAFNLLRSSSASATQLLRWAASILILIGFFYNLAGSINSHHLMMTRLRSTEQKLEEYLVDYAAAVGKSRDSMKILWAFGVDSPCGALWHGNAFADFAFSKEIFRLCSDQEYFNIWNDQALSPDGWVPLDVVDWDILVTSRQILRKFPYPAKYGARFNLQAKTSWRDNVTLIHSLSASDKDREVVLAEFRDPAEQDNWSAHPWNNSQSLYLIADNHLQLSYKNNRSQRDIVAYILTLPQPVPAVQFIQLRVRIQAGTHLSLGVKTDGQWISSPALNQYPGIGAETWETLSVPVNGRLEALNVSLAEIHDLETTPEYRIDLDGIKAIIQNTPISKK